MIYTENHRENKLALLILSVPVLVTLIIGVYSFIAPPAIFPDPSWGFQAMRSMELGGPFNQIVGPDQGNIADNYGYFLTWWSPGQYLVPYFFKSLFHLNVGQAAAITSVLCEVVGLLGFFAFFKRVGFKPVTAALSVAFIASQVFYFIPYAFYNGGEVLMFAYAGWFLYGCFYFKRISIPMLLFVLFAGWIGFFCKSSMLLVYASGLFCMWINLSPPRKDYAAWIKNGVAIGIPFVISVITIKLFYLSKGENPTSGSNGGLRIIWETFAFPLGSPLLAGFSVDDLTRGLVYHPDGPMFSPVVTVLILIGLAAASIALIWAIIKYVPYRPYVIAVVVFYVVFFLFFGQAFVRQLAISYEGRHFRIVGLLVIPGAIYLIERSKTYFKAAFGLIWIFIALQSFTIIHREYWFNREEGVRGNTGIVQQFIDKPTLNYLLQADKTQRNATFVFTSADLGLEIQHNRIITIEPIGADVGTNYDDYTYKGHAGPLYILLPSEYEANGGAQFIMEKCFPGYKDFKPKKVSEDYTVWEAK
ncbi:hypothetical protein [Mucilaginibacter terrae]|uniref:Glycosyltransferase RgtA/B/C/D-like domain-containing protein n=1 Tax=Mucilaginibacter terrae TaxID=1955052 RepID=A0ABU3GSE3_9SPHI|nr:hypothetical protein [Mucilaginibacter terrae]MDT3402693.1 hypothetical protein [Mucilaginibacter terrae]